MIVFISLFLGLSTLFYLAILWRLTSGLQRLKDQKCNPELAGVTVIVCAHNEERNMQNCIAHLQAQQYPIDKIEFILVDDRSTDQTAKMMKEAASEDKRFKTFSISDRLPDFAPKKRAIDLGVQQAKNDIILLTDADGRPGPHWAEQMVSFFKEDVDVVLGYAPYAIKPATHFIKKILALEYLSHAAIAAATTGLHFPVTCVGTNMAYRKSLYREVGGFGKFKNQISGDDDLFLTHVREQKRYKFAYATTAESQVFNNPPRLWSKFLHQRMRYASKGFKYPLKVTAALVVYFFYNLILLLLSFSWLFQLKLFFIFLIIVGLKWLGEFLFMRLAAKRLSDRRNLKIFVVAALFHIPYVVVFAILGQFDYFKWAEHQAERGTQKAGQ